MHSYYAVLVVNVTNMHRKSMLLRSKRQEKQHVFNELTHQELRHAHRDSATSRKRKQHWKVIPHVAWAECMPETYCRIQKWLGEGSQWQDHAHKKALYLRKYT